MSSADYTQDSLIDQVAQEMAEMGMAADAFDEAAAAALHVNQTDLRCLYALYRHGAMTAGQLADDSGLTPGAITTALDRVERAGYARRVRDENDRRRVLVELTPEGKEPGERVYGGLAAAARTRMADLTEEQLLVVRDYLRRSRDLYLEHADMLAAPVAGAAPAGDVHVAGAGLSAPLGLLRSGRLEFTGGASLVTLRVDAAMTDLYRAEYEGAAPEVRVKDGTVAFTHVRRWRPFDWSKQAVTVTLNGSVPWEIAVRGGLWKFTADLGALELRAFEIQGGASDVTVTLPPPVGIVPVRISGGANMITLHRPADTAAQAQVSGGATKLVFDDQQFSGIGGKTSVESPGCHSARNRYEIRLSGGASSLTIDAR